MLKKVISGGQTGVDIAGLEAAKEAGFQTGGYMPRGFLTEDGKKPVYAKEFEVMATSSPDYPDRTRLNIRNSDATLQIAANWKSRGEKLTSKIIEELNKKSLQVTVSDPGGEPSEEQAKKVADWINAEGITTLNIAGNSESTCPGIHDWASKLLRIVFRLIREEGNLGV